MTPNVSRLSGVNAISMVLDAQKRARYDCGDQEKMLMKWVFSAYLQVLPHEQIFRIWEAVTRQTQIDFALPNIFIEIEKNPLSASGQAPVASESVVAWSARGALRGVAREQA